MHKPAVPLVNAPVQRSAPRGLPQRREEPTHSLRTVHGQGGRKDPNDFSAFTLSLSKQKEVGGKETSVLRGGFVGKKRIVKRQPMNLVVTEQ